MTLDFHIDFALHGNPLRPNCQSFCSIVSRTRLWHKTINIHIWMFVREIAIPRKEEDMYLCAHDRIIYENVRSLTHSQWCALLDDDDDDNQTFTFLLSNATSWMRTNLPVFAVICRLFQKWCFSSWKFINTHTGKKAADQEYTARNTPLPQYFIREFRFVVFLSANKRA